MYLKDKQLKILLKSYLKLLGSRGNDEVILTETKYTYCYNIKEDSLLFFKNGDSYTGMYEYEALDSFVGKVLESETQNLFIGRYKTISSIIEEQYNIFEIAHLEEY